MRKARAIAMALAVAALILLLLSGPGTKAGWWPWMTGIWFMRGAAYVGLFAAAVSLVLLILLAVPRWRVRPWVPLVSLCIALAAAAPPLILVSRAKTVPPIHDITTDTADPPAFVALLAARNQSPNGSAHGGPEIAAQQQKAYADIKPKVVPLPPREAMQKAIDAARSLGWEVVASDAAAGRIEATDTTAWFGFKDDVVVRVRPEGAGSRIDVRSASRVGKSDIGANAARVREFLGKL
ncbi:MAG TPA: DUF1499 domain-containing protein [Usitatibacter sp.]|nr:DUF1499 domain-containing protein [Usitatibacter sp.]